MISSPAPGAPGVLTLSDAEAVSLGDGGVILRDGLLDPAIGDAARDLLESWYADGRLTPAGVGRAGHKANIRGDLTTWLEPHHPAPLSDLFLLFEALRLDLAPQLRLGLHRFAVQAARYGAGAGYKRHCDAFRGDPNRILTAIVYLNPDWTPGHGGELQAWTPTGIERIAPILGRLVVFRSDVVHHEVLPTRAPRWAVTSWYRGAESIPLLPDPPSLDESGRDPSDA